MPPGSFCLTCCIVDVCAAMLCLQYSPQRSTQLRSPGKVWWLAVGCSESSGLRGAASNDVPIAAHCSTITFTCTPTNQILSMSFNAWYCLYFTVCDVLCTFIAQLEPITKERNCYVLDHASHAEM